MNIPLHSPEKYFGLLIDNHNTMGTDEQKMLALRRRFDYILRQAVGSWNPNGSFYKESLEAIKNHLGSSAKKADWKEFNRMRNNFNQLMHADTEVSNQDYLYSLQRMALFISTLTGASIPQAIYDITNNLKTLFRSKITTIVPIYCCIDQTAISDPDERDAFNFAARQFRTDLLNNTKLTKRIDFKFIISGETEFLSRDLSDNPPQIIASSKSPREDALLYSLKELNRSKVGIIMMLFGGAPFTNSDAIMKEFHSLNKQVKVYPIILASHDNPYTPLLLSQRVLQMRPDCYEEFFSWLYDCIVLYYTQ